MESKIMNKGTLEVRYRDTVLDIRPDWFTIYTEYDGLIESLKYQCETKDAYPDNMFPESSESWFHLLSFEDERVIDGFCDLIAAYVNDWIEEYLEKYSMWLKQAGFVIKYIK